MARRQSLAKFIRGLEPGKNRRPVSVPGIPNLYCRVSPTGHKALTIAVRPKGAKNLVWRPLPPVFDTDIRQSAGAKRVK